jgi:Leucine-rich repeat (LRR) protein
VLSFKNSNIKDETLRLLWEVKTPLPILQLDLSQNFSFVTDTAVEIIVESVCLKNLKILNIGDNQISDDSMVMLARSPNMHHLEELILYGNSDITGAGLLLMAQSPFLKHLKHLDLHATSVDDEGMHELMKSENCQELEKLNLSMSWKLITDKTLYAIANSKFCKKLAQLLLEDCKVGDQGIDELSES